MTDQHGAPSPDTEPKAPQPAEAGSEPARDGPPTGRAGAVTPKRKRPRWPEQHEFTSNRLNRLAEALGARSYLEIGVEQGMTFELVKVAERTAVDHTFAFDTADLLSETTTFAEMTSDEFFSDLPAGRQFDLIYVDGMHTFEQTYRDLCNCILHSHPRTAILVDDTLPADVYSSLRDEDQALAFREAAGGESTAWHGDTYKVVFAVHDFHLGLDYRTIVGAGNPQTLIWRSNAGRRQPLLDSMEAISRLTYFELIDQIDVLRQYPEELTLNECIAAINRAPGPAPA
jgi:methyltransferase family protein